MEGYKGRYYHSGYWRRGYYEHPWGYHRFPWYGYFSHYGWGHRPRW
jgi:hypothetical protein